MEASVMSETKRALSTWLAAIKDMIEDVSPVDEHFYDHICNWFDAFAVSWVDLCDKCGIVANLTISKYDADYQTISVNAGGRQHSLVLHKLAVWPKPEHAAALWLASRL